MNAEYIVARYSRPAYHILLQNVAWVLGADSNELMLQGDSLFSGVDDEDDDDETGDDGGEWNDPFASGTAK